MTIIGILTANCARHVARVLAMCGLLLASGAVARADIASPWAEGMNSRVRLISGHVNQIKPGTMVAGVEIELANGWKTYWRTPGDTGIPPHFSWTGSHNLAAAEVLYPAPLRFDDPAGQSIGYKNRVLFPVLLRPAHEGGPVSLKLTLDYAVCEKLCIPERAELALMLPAQAASQAPSRALQEGLSRVPAPLDPGAAHGKVTGVAIDMQATPALMRIETVHAADSDDAELFIEGPQDWYLTLPLEEKRVRKDGNLMVSYTMALDALPGNATLSGTLLTFTIISAGKAVSQAWTLR